MISRRTFLPQLRQAWLFLLLFLLAPVGLSSIGLPSTGLLSIPSASEASAQTASDAGGIPVTSQEVVQSCSACHSVDDSGRMSRISSLRKTPEGWQTSLRRMMGLYGVQLDAETAGRIVRYLADNHGIAPEELRPALFEVERVRTDFEYPDEETYNVCAACHSLGRVITQRRSTEEWKLLAETHQGLYPIVDRQTFRRGGQEEGQYAVDRVTEHLAERYPLDTPEWGRWTANVRPPRLEGSWVLSGREDGEGRIFGRVEVAPVDGEESEFTTDITYVRARTGETVRRTGEVVIYTGYQWRGRSVASGDGEDLREVMFVEQGWREMHGRWFDGAYDERGIDVKLTRVGQDPVLGGIHPRGLRSGVAGQEVRIYGSSLPTDLAAEDIDLGAGVRVTSVASSSSGSAELIVDVEETAPVGIRDLYLGNVALSEAAVVYDRIHSIRVEPATGMARVGGAAFPKEYEFFDAIGYHEGPDGETGTDDDIRIGDVPVEWSIAEYPVTYDDDDTQFVGDIDENGRFVPAIDGPNPERSGNRNNVGDVWVVATHEPPDGGGAAEVLRGRGHLVVTVPLYIRFQPWPPMEEEFGR